MRSFVLSTYTFETVWDTSVQFQIERFFRFFVFLFLFPFESYGIALQSSGTQQRERERETKNINYLFFTLFCFEEANIFLRGMNSSPLVELKKNAI